jgi:cytochrome oxidase assembly protein ShyY1
MVTATGVLWPAESGSSAPDSLPQVVRRIDPGIPQAFAPYRLRSDYLVLAQPPVPEPYPVPTEAPEVGLGPHLGYAGQWFLFAGVVAVGYPVLLRRTLRRDRPAPESAPL